jgi:hypothetical protein
MDRVFQKVCYLTMLVVARFGTRYVVSVIDERASVEHCGTDTERGKPDVRTWRQTRFIATSFIPSYARTGVELNPAPRSESEP